MVPTILVIRGDRGDKLHGSSRLESVATDETQMKHGNSVGSRLLQFTAVAAIAGIALSAAVVAQNAIIVGPNGAVMDSIMASVDLPSDRTMARGIERAKDRIAEGEYSQAIRFLDEVLAGAQDSFIAVGETGEHVGLKETASAMIRDLPADGRAMYQSTFGPVAKKKLADALASGDMSGLREVAQHYFYTPAGYEAALLVAQQEADSGRHLSAGLLYQQLLDTPEAASRLNPQLAILAAKSKLAAGDAEEASKLLSGLNSLRATTVEIAGRKEQLSTMAADPLAWLKRIVGTPRESSSLPEDQWLMPRGNPERNGHAVGGLPHVRIRWEARLLSHPQFETVHDELWATLAQREMPLPSAGTPLAIGDTIVATTAHNVVAIDFKTGKRIWQTQPQRVTEFEQLVNYTGNATAGVGGQIDTNTHQSQAFARRVWEDYLYNSISSDGEHVFVIRDLKLPEFNEIDSWAPFRGEMGNDGDGYANRLCAYDLATQGKLVWEIDGAENSGELAGAYFLGAPVVVDDNLYCLAEIKSAIHLVAIARKTGAVAWVQQLAGLQNGIEIDPLRRMQAAMPSYSSGILVCPTGAGVVIGINLEKKALAWAYQYETNRNPMTIRLRENGRMIQQDYQWLEGAAVLASGCVLLSPPESNYLHCLDLVTGKFRWKAERGDGMYVAGVEGERVLVVGTGTITALYLSDGKPAWSQTAALKDDVMPSGRGFFSDGKYFLPLTSSEVVAIDLADGNVVERTQSRAGIVLGNLVAHQGAILSQNGKFLERFDQIDVLRDYTESRLAEDPDDFDALRTLGELTYNEGKVSEAIKLLEKAYGIAPDDKRIREVLGEALLEAIEQDFAKYQDRLPQLREILTDSPGGMLSLLRIEGEGLLELDEPLKSFEACVQIQQSPNQTELLAIDAAHQASVDSWLRAQIGEIWNRADADAKTKISARVTELFEGMPEDRRDEFVKTFGAAFGNANELLLDRAEEFAAKNEWLQAQQIYLDYVETDNPSRGAAVATCSKMLHEMGWGREAAGFDELLAGPLSDVVCLEGKTGEKCLDAWAGSPPKQLFDWPYGKVEVEQPPMVNAAAAQRLNTPLVEVRLERSDSVLERCNLYYSFRTGELIVRDPTGREIFRKGLGESDRQMFDRGMYAVSRGNLVIVSFGHHIIAVDTSGGKDKPAVLWSKQTIRNNVDRFRQQLSSLRSGTERPGTHRTPRSQAENRWIGVLGPISSDSFVYQDQRGLVCVDSLTGRIRWTRTDSPNACQLFGNEETVVALEEQTSKAQAYNMADGRKIGEVEIPRWHEQVSTRGLDVVGWERTARGECRLSSRDVMSGSVHWHHQFARGSHLDVALNRYVAVVEPIGRYVVIDTTDGSVLVDQKFTPLPHIRDVHLFAGTDNFVVAVGVAPAQVANNRVQQQYMSTLDFVAFDGQLMAFDAKSGEPLWSRPADVVHQSLMISQPLDAPIITFVGNHRRQDANGTHQLMNLLLLEKVSGRVLFADDSLPYSANYFVVSTFDESNEVLVEMANRMVKLKFTDAPRPPEPPAQSSADDQSTDGPTGLYKILKRLGGGR
jgi:outer membrane protein assembly factor BamB